MMKLINLIEEDYTNYRKPGMFLGFPHCSGKCNVNGQIVCQNNQLRYLFGSELIDISSEEILDRFFNNYIPQCLIFGGLEPFDSFNDMCNIIYHYGKDKRFVRKNLFPTTVIYTGFYPYEIREQLKILQKYGEKVRLIIKFGRFIPDRPHHIDPILGVELASDNQFALQYNCELDIWGMKTDYEARVL